MIYLIGGPPKCGKTTLAKSLFRKLQISWIPVDYIDSILSISFSQKEFFRKFPKNAIRHKTKNSNDIMYSQYPHNKIVDAYILQAKVSQNAINVFIECALKANNDFIIEGYQVTPELAAKLIQQYGEENITAAFLIKTDPLQFVENIEKSTTHNDWILAKTKNPKKIYPKIAKMIAEYSKYFEKEAEQYGFKVFQMDTDFEAQMQNIIKYFSSFQDSIKTLSENQK